MVQENRLNQNVIVICGPTASGKTALAIALAKALNTEIISADSMNIYQGLNIGTAKPSTSERAEIPHHMIDIVAPNATFSVGDYKERALPIVNRLIQEGKIPIICGGTGFYINSLLYDFSYGKAEGNSEIREKYEKIANSKGNEFVHSMLKAVDPQSAELLHPNDIKRVIRALEIFEQTGIQKSAIRDSLNPKFHYISFTIDHLRGDLYRRINDRVDSMFTEGLVEEVKHLTQQGITLDNQSMQGIGYKETLHYLQFGGALNKLKEEIKQNTRRYAKRQITFFKRDNNLVQLLPESTEQMIKHILEYL